MPAGTTPQDVRPSIAVRKKGCAQIFLEKDLKGTHRQSDEHWNRFKFNVGENFRETGWRSAYWLFRAHRHHPELNQTYKRPNNNNNNTLTHTHTHTHTHTTVNLNPFFKATPLCFVALKKKGPTPKKSHGFYIVLLQLAFPF